MSRTLFHECVFHKMCDFPPEGWERWEVGGRFRKERTYVYSG